jgi:cell wall assembly regulator SMI1
MESIYIDVEPGICGFCCQVQAWRQDKHRASVKITGSQCIMIQKLTKNITEVRMRDIFVPHTRNPIFKASVLAGCHLSCPIPAALLKAAEVALELALPKDVRISFVQHEKKDST